MSVQLLCFQIRLCTCVSLWSYIFEQRAIPSLVTHIEIEIHSKFISIQANRKMIHTWYHFIVSLLNKRCAGNCHHRNTTDSDLSKYFGCSGSKKKKKGFPWSSSCCRMFSDLLPSLSETICATEQHIHSYRESFSLDHCAISLWFKINRGVKNSLLLG